MDSKANRIAIQFLISALFPFNTNLIKAIKYIKHPIMIDFVLKWV